MKVWGIVQSVGKRAQVNFAARIFIQMRIRRDGKYKRCARSALRLKGILVAGLLFSRPDSVYQCVVVATVPFDVLLVEVPGLFGRDVGNWRFEGKLAGFKSVLDKDLRLLVKKCSYGDA